MTLRPFLQRLLTLMLVITLLTTITPAHAQNKSSLSSLPSLPSSLSPSSTPYRSPEGCVEEIRSRLRQQRRLWQDVLYGKRPAQEESDGTARYAEDGTPWIKTGPNRWRTAVKEFENTEWTDEQMNRHTEWTGMNEIAPEGTREKRTGIFEKKGAITPQFIPDIVAGYRDFECRTAMVCKSASMTLERADTDGDGLLQVSTLGCEELVAKPLERCQFGEEYVKNAKEQIDLQIEETAPETQCASLARDMTIREAAFVKIAVSYDAAYRSLLQFAGAFDGFLRAMRGDLLGPIENALPLLNALSRVSCFAAKCQ